MSRVKYDKKILKLMQFKMRGSPLESSSHRVSPDSPAGISSREMENVYKVRLGEARL